jgi:periplasmic divalent cation tolerance protein
MNPGLLQVTTTAGSRPDAENLVRTVVAERLAACGQVGGPLTSYYWWEGRLDSAEEWQCALKTTAVMFPALETRIRQLHTYQNPEIIAVPIVGASEAYAAWVAANVAGSTEGRAL